MDLSVQRSLIAVAEDLHCVLPKIQELITAAGLGLDEHYIVALTRQRVYTVLQGFHTEVAAAVTIAAVDAFIEADECHVAIFVLSHVDPRVNVVERAIALVNAALRPQFDRGLSIPTLDSLFGGGSARQSRLLVAPTGKHATHLLELLGKFRLLDQRSSGALESSLSLPRTSLHSGTTRSRSRSSSQRQAPPSVSASRLHGESRGSRHSSAGAVDEGVDMDQLAAFVYPPGEIHTRSTGLLIVFALCGPLSPDGSLRGGRAGGRPLTPRELKSMIDDVERDDVLSVFTGGSRLCDTHAVEVEVHALSRKLPNTTRAQFDAMFIDLPRDRMGRCSFHQVQDRILAARKSRVEGCKRMYPSLTAADRDPHVLRTQFREPDPAFGHGTIQTRLGAKSMAGQMASTHASTGRGAIGASFATTMVNLATTGTLRPHVPSPTKSRAPGAGSAPSSSTGGTSSSTSARPGRPSAGVGLSEMQLHKQTERLVHKASSHVVEIDQLHERDIASHVVANLRFCRGDFTTPPAGIPVSVPRPEFNVTAPLTLHRPRGSTVPGTL